MKKIFAIFTIAMMALMFNSCGTSSKLITNDPYTGVGFGYANDENAAMAIAYSQAAADLQHKAGVAVEDETKTVYTQTNTGALGNDRSITTRTTIAISEGTIMDVRLEYEPLSAFKCRTKGFACGYRAVITASPRNVASNVASPSNASL